MAATKLAWKGGKVKTATTPKGTFRLYKVPGSRESALEYVPAKTTRTNPPRSARGPVGALKRLAASVAA